MLPLPFKVKGLLSFTPKRAIGKGMRVLFIGGTGNISTAVSRRAVAAGLDLYLLNRGSRGVDIAGAKSLRVDIDDVGAVEAALGSLEFDAVVNFIAFVPEHVERDLRLFARRTKQYVFISSASAYEKPPRSHLVVESTPLRNPYWEYSRNKIACEERLMRAYRDDGLPVTIVRPSLTYDTVLPIAIGGWGCATLLERLKAGRPIIVHGDGTSLWTVTHAEDFAKGFVPLLGHPLAIGQSYHITSDEVLTWNQIYGTIADAMGVVPRIVHLPSDFIAAQEPSMAGGLLGDKAHSAIFDNSKIKRLVPDFLATVPFHLGIRRTIDWFRADPQRWLVRAEVEATMDRLLATWQSSRPAG
jgi:nucleoside-diphosphate-sugar epimerase